MSGPNENKPGKKKHGKGSRKAKPSQNLKPDQMPDEKPEPVQSHKLEPLQSPEPEPLLSPELEPLQIHEPEQLRSESNCRARSWNHVRTAASRPTQPLRQRTPSRSTFRRSRRRMATTPRSLLNRPKPLSRSYRACGRSTRRLRSRPSSPSRLMRLSLPSRRRFASSTAALPSGISGLSRAWLPRRPRHRTEILRHFVASWAPWCRLRKEQRLRFVAACFAYPNQSPSIPPLR